MSNAAVSSLAILKVNWDRLGRDYLDNFSPFVVEALRVAPQEVISLPELQIAIHDLFGLHLPLNPLKQLLSRAARTGHVRRDSGVYYREPAKCSESTFVAVRQSIEDGTQRLLDELIGHAAKNHGAVWSQGEAEAALLAFVGEDGLEALYAKAERRVVSVPSQSAGTAYVVATLANELQSKNSPLFDDLLTLAKGHLLANALFLPDSGRVNQRFANTRVYLDTSFLVFAAGYAGPDRQAPCDELLALLKDYGATLCCFIETIEEVRGILDACATIIRRGNLQTAYGPSIEFFVSKGYPSSDIDLLAARCQARIAAMGIRIEERPGPVRAHQIDETGLEAALQTAIHYSHNRARVHDVDCVSAIMRVRGGRESNSIENSRAIFVTTNPVLARVAREFFQPEVPAGTVAPCIMAHALGNLLWLKNPTKAPDLPLRRVIADAYAAMQPPDGLWKLYLVETARLQSEGTITADEYYLLRHSHSAKRALMDITHGDPDAFVEGTVPEVLEIARSNLRADLSGKLAAAEGDLQDRQKQLLDYSIRDDNRVNNLARAADSIARWCARGVFYAALLILGVATLYGLPYDLPTFQHAWWRYALTLAQLALLFYSVVSIGWGTSLKDLVARFESALSAGLLMRLRRWFDI